jgi:hypothetical protein
MTCPACLTFETNRKTGSFNSKCKACRTRSIAQGQPFFQSMQAKRRTAEYRRQLEVQFGKAGVENGHVEVKRVAGLIRGEVV